jgi:hypothetical protein
VQGLTGHSAMATFLLSVSAAQQKPAWQALPVVSMKPCHH